MQKAEYLFIYGSLRRALRNPISSVLIRHGELVGEATFTGKLFDLGMYPGAVLSDQPTEVVKGELYRLSDKDRVFSVLDPYEGYNPKEAHPTEFRRRRVAVSFNDGEAVNAWTYLYCQSIEGLNPISSGDYIKYHIGKSKRKKA